MRSAVKLDKQGNIIRRGDESDDEEDQGSNRNRYNRRAGYNGADAHVSGMAAIRVRESHLESNLYQQVTVPQEMIARDDSASTRRYDMISIFGLRPPELVPVFQNPNEYFRLTIIGDGVVSEDKIREGLNSDLRQCRWFDCLSRPVHIRLNGLSEVMALVQENLAELQTTQYLSGDPDRKAFNISANEMVRDLVRVHEADADSLSEADQIWKSSSNDWIKHDGLELLPIPYFSDVNPRNTQQFFISMVLTMGKYTTEIDALKNATPRRCLERVRLISTATDVASRRRDLATLLYNYVTKQVVYLPNSFRRTDGFVVHARQILEDIVMRDEFPQFEIPFLTTELFASNEEKFKKFWDDMKASQLDSIYATLGRNTPGIPDRRDVENASRYDHLRWDPTRSLIQAEGQNRASFEEQSLALRTAVYSIQRYRSSAVGQESLTLTKNVITHGAPGSGKSFVGQTSVLYALSQGLRCLSTSLMGPRALQIGGIHYHRLFCLNVNNMPGSIHPYREAELALQKLRKKPTYMHALLTMDVMFLDEAGQTSAEQLAVFDIILRKLRKSSAPFGGVLLLGTMDHTQLQPIASLPFLLSTSVLTCFTMVQLRESVR